MPFPDDKKHREVWQKGIQMAKDMLKVDGAEYAFSTWFTEARELDLVGTLMDAKSEEDVAWEVYSQCLFDYSEAEINEKIELALQAYRAANKGDEAWLRSVKARIESKKIEARMVGNRAQEILNALDNGEYLIRVKYIASDTLILPSGEKSIPNPRTRCKQVNPYEGWSTELCRTAGDRTF